MRTSKPGEIAEGGGVMTFPSGISLSLDSGASIERLEIAYRTYGSLNETRSNA
jgi:homoserine O-acetyltransferase